jgi:dTDP-4-dehydrorhamnose reductase
MLGRVLRRRLSRKHRVTGLSKSGRYGAEPCDLAENDAAKRFFENRSFDLVIHAAAFSDVDGCERDPELAHRNNGSATRCLAEICGLTGTPLIYLSTDYVFDGRKASLYKEEDTPAPVNVYGMTKLEGEFFVNRLAPCSAVVRTSWLFGPENPANFVNAIAARLRKETVVRVLDDQTNSPTSVEDLSEALEWLGGRLAGHRAGKGAEPLHETFHVCNRGSATRYAMALKIREYLSLRDVRVEKAERRELDGRVAIRPRHSVMSCRHFESAGGKPLRGWEESLKEYLAQNVLCAS